MRKKQTSAAVLAVAAALALTSVGPVPAFAASTPAKALQTVEAASETDFSSHRRRYYRGNRAGLAAFTAIVGAIATYAAAREYRKAQERRYHYYYGPPPYYYYPYRRYYYRYW